MYLINSTIVVEDGEGNEIGEVRQRWHLWKRNYDLYFGRRQFADIQGNFLAWEFVLRDEHGGMWVPVMPLFQKLSQHRRCHDAPHLLSGVARARYFCEEWYGYL